MRPGRLNAGWRCFWNICWQVGLLAGLGTGAGSAAAPLAFELQFSPRVLDRPFSGRVYVMLSKRPAGEPRHGPNWFNPDPFFAWDVTDWKPNQPRTLRAGNIGFPLPLEQLKADDYSIQAVLDLNRGDRNFSNAPGNGFSKSIRQNLDPHTTGVVRLDIDQVVEPRKFHETPKVKFFEQPSKRLTDFHGVPIRLRAGVILPASFANDPQRKYPVIYDVPGFGGNHFAAPFYAMGNPTQVADVEMIHVVLDPDCRWGHHVFADSATNGPCGQALTEEFIPALEKAFRAIGQPTARYVTGHSSGGWSSLWLQVTYPEFFGGVWSTAPDPVDFRDFQRINLYDPTSNMFSDTAGKPRPLARRGNQPVLFYRGFSDMEEVMGHGGQLRSFEAVFSPRAADGTPAKLWDRKTGAIDPAVAKAWEKYDIQLVLRRNWQQLAPKLAGKLHVYMGDMDTFYLEGATRLLGATLKELGSDAKVELFPGKDHGSLMTPTLRKRIAQEMAETFLKHHRGTDHKPVGAAGASGTL